MFQDEEGCVPLHIGRLILKEGAHGFFIRYIAKPDIMLSVLKMIANYGLKILHMTYSSPAEPSPKASLIIFCDFNKTNMSPEELKETLEKNVEGIEEVKVVKPILKGLTYDRFHFPTMFMDERAVIIGAALLKDWLVGIRDAFGTGGEAILFYVGFDMGSTIFKILTEKGFRDRDLWRALAAYLPSCGIAKSIHVKFEESFVEVDVIDNVECSLVKDRAKCFSQWLRGILSGFASGYFNKKVYARELNCTAKGDASCFFAIPA